MARNNRRRAGEDDELTLPDMDDAPTTLDSLLSFVTPTEIVDLPSRGIFYPEGHPLHNQETVEIKYMTAKEEDILTSRSLLQKGLAIDRLIQSVLLDKSIDINSILVGDKNAILVAIRITGYGESYDAAIGCPACGETSDVTFDLTNSSLVYPDDNREDVTFLPDGTFEVKLPTLGARVGLRLLDGRDETRLSKLEEIAKNKKLQETSVTNQFRAIIASVEGHSDQQLVSDLINILPAKDSRYIHSIYKEIVPDIDLSQPFSCHSCGHHVHNMGVPLTAAFFWPDR